MSTAYTMPVSVTRRAARTVNHPDPAPMSATFFPAEILRMSSTRLICSLSSRPGESKIDKSPVYGLLVLRGWVCEVDASCADENHVIADRTIAITTRRLNDPNIGLSLL